MKTILVLLLLLTANVAYSGETFFIEDFNSLKSWKPIYFSKVTKHSTYTLESDGNPYNDKSEMILLQKGVLHVGKWLKEEVNIIEDYKQAFGEAPPAIANIAVMNDSDNTGESSISYVDFIQVYNSEVVAE